MLEIGILQEGQKFAGKRLDRRSLRCFHESLRGTGSEIVIVALSKENSTEGFNTVASEYSKPHYPCLFS